MSKRRIPGSRTVVWRFFERHNLTFKKALHAAEQQRPDVARARRRWRKARLMLNPARLVFIDETASSTNMVRLRGRCLRAERLIGSVPHANAIGTTALRARLLPAPHSTKSLKLLREYVQIRLDITQRVPSTTELDAATAWSNALQEALWQQAKTVAATEKGLVPTGLFIQTLNDMIDNQEKRLAALRTKLPNIVLMGLYGIAIIASAFTGYASGLEARRSRLPIYIMGMLVAAVILLIQDIDRPSTGFIRVSQQPMIDTAAGISSYSD